MDKFDQLVAASQDKEAHIDWILTHMNFEKEKEESLKAFLTKTGEINRCFLLSQYLRWILTKKKTNYIYIHKSNFEIEKREFSLCFSQQDLKTTKRLTRPIEEEGFYLFNFSGNEGHEAIVQINKDHVKVINSWGGFDNLCVLDHDPDFWWSNLVFLNRDPAKETLDVVGKLFGFFSEELLKSVDDVSIPFFPKIRWEKLV